MAGAQLGGVLTDRFGHLMVQLGSLLGGAVCFHVLSRLDTLPALGVSLFVLGVIDESFRPACNAAITAYTPRVDRPRAFALNRTAVNLGVTFGPAFGGVLADLDFGLLFQVNSVMWVLSALVLFRVARFWSPLSGQDVEPAAPSATGRGGSPWADGFFLVAMGLLFVHALIFALHHMVWLLFLSEVAGLSKTRIGMLFAVNTGIILAFEMLLTERLAKRPALRSVAWGTLLMGLGFGLTGLQPSFGWVAFTVVVWKVGEMFAAPMIVTFVAQRAGPAHRGRYMGVLGIAISGALAVAPVLGAALYDRVHPQAPWVLSALLGIVSAVGFFALERHRCRHLERCAAAPGADE